MSLNVKCFFFVYLFFCANSQKGFAQDTIPISSMSENKRVEWVAEYPVLNKSEKEVFLKRVFNFVTGKKTVGLNKPISVIKHQDNVMFVADQGFKTVIKIENNIGETLKGFNKSEWDFSSLVGTSNFTGNNILFSDSYLNSIFVYSADNDAVDELNSNLILNQATGIAYSAITNEIWVVETASHRIAVLNEKGELIKTIGKRGINPGEFNYPTFIWIDKLGIIYVIDSLNFRIQIFDKDGSVLNVFGEPGDGSGNFARPKGVAVDSKGNIYVVDALFHVVQIFNKSGNFLYSFGKQGREKGEFWMPVGIFIDEKDFIYVADSYNSRIQIFKLSSITEEKD